jgi:uncharacterized protein
VRVYLDSCLIIYLVEGHPRFAAPLRARIATHADAIFAVSGLTRLEVLARPLRDRDASLAQRYETFLAANVYLPMDDSVLRYALDWRVAGLKTPDALHVALAQHHACDALWTNDDRLAKVAPALAVNATAGAA